MGKKRGPTPRDFFCIRGGLSQGFGAEEKIPRSAERFRDGIFALEKPKGGSSWLTW